MKPHVPLLLYGLLAGEVATAVPITGSVGPARHVVVDDPMFMRPVNWPLPAQGPPRQSNMTATTLLTAPYKKKRAVETTYAEHDTYINRFFPYWKTVEVSPFRQPAEEQPAEEQPLEEQPAQTQFAEEQSAHQKPAEKQSADKKPAEKKPADKKPADKKPADKKPADKKPANKKPDGKKADSNPAAATPTKKPSPGSERVTKNGPFKVVSADINNSAANKQTDCSSAASATTTKKNDDSTPTGSSSTFKKTGDDNDNNNNGNSINSGSTVYSSNISNSTVDDSVINNSTVVDSRVLDSTVSDANILHSTVVDDVVIDSSTLEDTTVAGQSAVTEGSTLSGSDVLGGSAVAGGSTVVDSNILDGASVVDGSNVIGESVVGEGSAVAGESNVFDGSVVTRRDDLLAKRKMPWMPDSVKIVMCIFSPIIGCAMAAASEMNYPGERQKKRQLVDDGGSGSSAVTLAKRMKSTSEMTGMVVVCVFMPFLCPIYGDGRGKKRQLLADGGSSGGSSSSSSSSAVVSSLDKRNKGLEAMPVGAKVAVCIIFVWLCPVAVMSSGEDPPGPGPDKRELVQDGGSNGSSSSSSSISNIDIPIMPIMAKRGGPKKLSKPARTTLCVLFPFICPVVWRRGLDVDDAASSQISSSSSNIAVAPLGKRALRQCGAPLPWWCSNVTKRATTHPHLPAVADDAVAAAAVAEGSIKLLDKRKWTPAKFILCRLLFIFCFTDLGTRDLAHAHHAAVDDEANTTVVATKRSPQDPWVATQVTEYLDKLVKNEADAPPEVRVLPDVEPPDEEADKKRRKTKRSAVELDVTVGGTNVAHIAAETEGKKGLLQVATDFIMRVVLGQVPSDPTVESKKKEDGDDARKKEKREEESSYSPPAPPPAEGTEVAAVAKRKFSWEKAIGIIAGSTVIIDHFKRPIEAFIDGLGELLDMKKRSVPPPETRRDVAAAAAAVEDRNANTNTDPTAPSGDGDDDGDGNSKVSEVSEAVGSLIDGINGKRSSVPGGAAEEEESTMTKRAADHDRRATEFFKPLLDFPGHGHHRVKEFNIPAHAPGHGYHRASKFYMPPLFLGLPLSPKN